MAAPAARRTGLVRLVRLWLLSKAGAPGVQARVRDNPRRSAGEVGPGRLGRRPSVRGRREDELESTVSTRTDGSVRPVEENPRSAGTQPARDAISCEGAPSRNGLKRHNSSNFLGQKRAMSVMASVPAIADSGHNKSTSSRGYLTLVLCRSSARRQKCSRKTAGLTITSASTSATFIDIFLS